MKTIITVRHHEQIFIPCAIHTFTHCIQSQMLSDIPRLNCYTRIQQLLIRCLQTSPCSTTPSLSRTECACERVLTETLSMFSYFLITKPALPSHKNETAGANKLPHTFKISVRKMLGTYTTMLRGNAMHLQLCISFHLKLPQFSS